ncbi:Fc.00g115450.m01.CDS01 [Cosmosporella sp. VM-42]
MRSVLFNPGTGSLVSWLLLLQATVVIAVNKTFVPTPKDVASIQSKIYPDISLTFKEHLLLVFCTTLNPWSWDNVVNILYLDVPVQTGYPYTKPQNGTYNFETTSFTPAPRGADSIPINTTTTAAALSSSSPSDTVNTTAQVAIQLWQISQVWFQEFPEIHTKNENERIANGTIDDPHAKAFSIGTLGINNGCIDTYIQAASYPEYAAHNTYGIRAIPPHAYEVAKTNLTKSNGCYDLINKCRTSQEKKDPHQTGNNLGVNDACTAATELRFGELQGAYTKYSTLIGSPVNFTLTGNTIPPNLFGRTGDPMIRSVKDVEYLLTSGVNLALAYGDRDYRCNRFGVENVRLVMEYPFAPSFRVALEPVLSIASKEQ